MLRIEKHLRLYQTPRFYSAFPAVTRCDGNKLIAAFRRAPNYYGLPGVQPGEFFHGDITSQLWAVDSLDNGETWGNARMVYAPPEGASQDAGLFFDSPWLYLNSFIWSYVPDQAAVELQRLKQDEFLNKNLTWMVPFGTYVMRSPDQGSSWETPVMPEPLPGDREVLPGVPARLHNRGNICRTSDGRLLLTGQILGFRPEFHSSVGIYESGDQGRNWRFLTVAADDGGIAVFEEPHLSITPSGKWVVLIRTHRDRKGKRYERAELWLTESSDQGKTWTSPRSLHFHAEPATALRLRNGRQLVVYGYRQEPYGVRCRICDAEFQWLDTAAETVIRDDASHIDTGYPGICPLGDDRYLIVYYMNRSDYHGASAIEGTIIKVEDQKC